MKFLSLILALGVAPHAAMAEESQVFVEYHAGSGSVSPEFEWNTMVTIYQDGKLEVQFCDGYDARTPTCRTRRGKATAGSIEAIRVEVLAADLLANPAADSEGVMVGGSNPGGTVVIEGTEVAILSEPVEADRARINAVKSKIEAALPERLRRYLYGN